MYANKNLTDIKSLLGHVYCGTQEGNTGYQFLP